MQTSFSFTLEQQLQIRITDDAIDTMPVEQLRQLFKEMTRLHIHQQGVLKQFMKRDLEGSLGGICNAD